MRELAMSPFLREAGENAWTQLTQEGGIDAKFVGKLSRIKSELLGGHGDIGMLSKKLDESPQLRRRLDDILGEGEPTSGEGKGRSKQLFDRYLSQYEEARKGIEASSDGKGSVNPLAALNIKGIIDAISSLTSAVNSAAKNP